MLEMDMEEREYIVPEVLCILNKDETVKS